MKYSNKISDKNFIYSENSIRNLSSVEVRITLPIGSSGHEEIIFTTSNKKILFITNNYQELHKDAFRDADDVFLKMLIDAILSCDELSKFAKSTWRKWNIYGIELLAKDMNEISSIEQEAYVHKELDRCCNYLSNSPQTAKNQYESIKDNNPLKWRLYE